jgi:mRNA-degrading endonuclease toxin of MazEF toxin-antitoxin module
MKQPCAINLHNLVTVEKDNLGRRLAQLSDARMSEVCGAIAFSLGCEG